MTNKSGGVNEKTYLLTTEDVEICPSQRLSTNHADECDEIVKVNDNNDK